MKKLLLIPLLLLTVLSMAACGGGDDEPFRPGQPETPDVSSLNVNITVGDRTVTATKTMPPHGISSLACLLK